MNSKYQIVTLRSFCLNKTTKIKKKDESLIREELLNRIKNLINLTIMLTS